MHEKVQNRLITAAHNSNGNIKVIPIVISELGPISKGLVRDWKNRK